MNNSYNDSSLFEQPEIDEIPEEEINDLFAEEDSEEVNDENIDQDKIDEEYGYLLNQLHNNTSSDGKKSSKKKKLSDEEKILIVKKVNLGLIAMIILLMSFFIGERYLLRKSNEEISVYYSIAEDTTDNSYDNKATTTSGLININTASAEELQKIKGIGEKRAKDIVEYRERNGIFRDIEEITEVNGIGEGIFEQIKEQICVE